MDRMTTLLRLIQKKGSDGAGPEDVAGAGLRPADLIWAHDQGYIDPVPTGTGEVRLHLTETGEARVQLGLQTYSKMN